MHLQWVDSSNAKVGEQREEEAEREEDSGGGDIAKRRREAEVDEESDHQCREYGENQSGDGRVFGGWAVKYS